jgi:DNA repair exonuclease SbcCD nuclease subunit
VPTLRFIQLSDLHLGAPFSSLAAERRLERRREQRRALEAAIQTAIDRTATAILLPGDLFDSEGVDAETLAFAVHAFARPGCPPVFIAPGNHDPCTTSSPYWNARLLAARGWSWPPQVHVFRTPTWSAVALEAAPITVWGRSFLSSAPASERPLAAQALPPAGDLDAARVHVAVFHGSREGGCPPGQKITAPFSTAEALAAPFRYCAVGHYHERSHLEASGPGGVRLAYAGSPIALNASEAGAHGVLEVWLDPDTRVVETEPIVLDERRVHALTVDVSGAASRDAVDARLIEAFEAAGVTARDIARVRLTGRIVHGVRYEAAGPEVGRHVFSLKLDLRELRPDYDLEGIRAREPTTTEDRFVQALMEDLDVEHDDAQRARILSALYYGLDALRLRDVAPAWEALSVSTEEAEA